MTTASHLVNRFIMSSTNKTPVAGYNVRFFVTRREAIGVANRMTTTFQQQHNAVNIKDYGWLVKNVVDKKVYDADGVLPNEVVQELQIKFR